jgi:hypothetical protein
VSEEERAPERHIVRARSSARHRPGFEALPARLDAGYACSEEARPMVFAPLAAMVALIENPAAARPDDPVSFAAVILLGLALTALAIGRPVTRR